MDVTQLYTGLKVRQYCNCLQCEVREQGMYASCTSIMYESVGLKGTLVWGVIMSLFL